MKSYLYNPNPDSSKIVYLYLLGKTNFYNSLTINQKIQFKYNLYRFRFGALLDLKIMLSY